MSQKSLVEYEIGRPWAHGLARAQTPRCDCAAVKSRPGNVLGMPPGAHSAERRSSSGGSDLTGAGFGSDLTGSRLPASTRGVSALADTSTEPVWSSTRSERG